MTSKYELNSITTWRKSSRSGTNGNCVEVACVHDVTWRKSSRSSANGNCVEVARPGETAVAVRDSKLPTEGNFPHLLVDAGTWSSLIAAVKTGEIS